MSTQFAVGKRAFGFCDVCGFRYKLSALRPLVVKAKATNILACPTCWSPDHPQLQLGMTSVFDPQALRNPRPDTAQASSREVEWGWGPVLGVSAEAELGDVVVPVLVDGVGATGAV